MGSRREEERNERIIRGLMKLPPNRRCINCNILGPQYVCINFWTFVCITCSGIHREFTHRVKSVSMSKFTSQEVESLQTGGNQRAREIYLKHWDIQRQKLPDNSKPEKVREFIKNVYVDNKYTMGTISSPDNDPRRASSYHSYSQSPPYDFQYEDRVYGKLTRKPGSERGISLGKMSSFVSSPTRFVEDKFANESASRISDFSVSSGGDLVRSNAGSPNAQDHQPIRVHTNHQEQSVDLFKLPGAPPSPFAAEKCTEVPSGDVVSNQVSELSGWADFDFVQPTKPVKDNHQPVDFFQQTEPIGDHHHQPVENHHNQPVNALALTCFDPFQPTEPVIDQHLQYDFFQQTEPIGDLHHQPVSALGPNSFEPFQPTEPGIDLFESNKPIQEHHLQPTEPVIGNHHQPIDFFKAAKPIEDHQHQPVSALVMNNVDLFQPTEPGKYNNSLHIGHHQPTEPMAGLQQQRHNVLVTQNSSPFQPTGSVKAKDAVPLSGFGSIQPTELVNELASNNTVSFEDIFSIGPVYMVEKINPKSTNPFDDSFDTDYIGSVSEPWFGSEVDANLGLVQATQIQIGNLSLEGPVVSIGGNPFA